MMMTKVFIPLIFLILKSASCTLLPSLTRVARMGSRLTEQVRTGFKSAMLKSMTAISSAARDDIFNCSRKKTDGSVPAQQIQPLFFKLNVKEHFLIFFFLFKKDYTY